MTEEEKKQAVFSNISNLYAAKRAYRLIPEYVAKEYVNTGILHIYRTSGFKDGFWWLDSDSLCGKAPYIKGTCSKGLSVDDMAQACSGHSRSVREILCADCVKHFYWTGEE